MSRQLGLLPLTAEWTLGLTAHLCWYTYEPGETFHDNTLVNGTRCVITLQTADK